MRRWAGEIYIGIAAIHTLVGVLLGTGLLADLGQDLGLHARGALLGLTRDGIVGAAMPRHAAEFGLFWFLTGGYALLIIGATLRWLYRTHRIVAPSFVHAACAALSVVGVIAMPISGFWILLLLSLLLLQDRSTTSTRTA